MGVVAYFLFALLPNPVKSFVMGHYLELFRPYAGHRTFTLICDFQFSDFGVSLLVNLLFYTVLGTLLGAAFVSLCLPLLRRVPAFRELVYCHLLSGLRLAYQSPRRDGFDRQDLLAALEVVEKALDHRAVRKQKGAVGGLA